MTTQARRVGTTQRLMPASNGVPITDAETMFAPMKDSTALLKDPPALRLQFQRDGYLLLRQVLDPADVLALRTAYLSLFNGALDPPGDGDQQPTAAVPAYGTQGHPAYAFVRGDHFAAFTSQQALTRIAQAVLGEPVTLMPRRILRHFDMSSQRASRAHVDFDYMDHGTDRVLTIWIPAGDCARETGGLVYLEGSHRIPAEKLDTLRHVSDRPSDRRPVSHDLGLTARTLGGRWQWTDYEAGDVSIHHPRLVHASLDNQSSMARVSVDLRFRAAAAEPDPRWQAEWSADDGY